MGSKKTIKLTNEEIESLYRNEINRREREVQSKKAFGVVKRKVRLTGAEKKELVAKEIYRREQIEKANGLLAGQHMETRKKLNPVLLVIVILACFIGLRYHTIKTLNEFVFDSELSTSDDVVDSLENAASVTVSPEPTPKPSLKKNDPYWLDDEPEYLSESEYWFEPAKPTPRMNRIIDVKLLRDFFLELDYNDTYLQVMEKAEKKGLLAYSYCEPSVESGKYYNAYVYISNSDYSSKYDASQRYDFDSDYIDLYYEGNGKENFRLKNLTYHFHDIHCYIDCMPGPTSGYSVTYTIPGIHYEYYSNAGEALSAALKNGS